ncbi:EpsI family protein [Pelomonas saccharophila]|uniref:EpsI family protein n=1 Tax=Roseateles saccharophilus TaxID=304 RepID=A0ABU1YSF0_ROSSA|nr:exosortase-associated protein EpsI, B-type [Roseateles saccharophilus]MDR7271782.1 EpsI family protein [Roseateles saccharophilus]
MSALITPVRLRALLAALLLVSASGLAHVAKPTQHLADQHAKVDLQTLFPPAFGNWRLDTSMPVTIISPDVEALLKTLYAQTVSRTYVGPAGERIMLSVAYGGDQSDATRAHRPDVCYPTQGFEILSNKDAAIDVGAGQPMPVRHMSAKLAQRYEPVTFWFVVGEHIAISGQQQKIAQLRYGMQGFIPDGMLVRVSSIDSDAEAAYRQQARFIADMRAAMPQPSRLRVFGSALAS